MMKNIEWEKNYSAKMFWGCERERADFNALFAA